MTVGFLMVLIGLQLNFVESYQLTPEATRFWVERFGAPENPVSNAAYRATGQAGQTGFQTPSVFQNAAFTSAPAITANARTIEPPRWICWPVIFMGVAFVFHGAAIHRGD